MSHGASTNKISTAREPPARATVLIGNKPSQYVEVAFPWELNNTDYLRRILGQFTLSLRPAYERAVTIGGCSKVRTGDNYEIDSRRVDAFYILKHIIENHEHYVEVRCNRELEGESPVKDLSTTSNLQPLRPDKNLSKTS
jgi:hypothetical protein